MKKGIYTYYKERLIEIGGHNKCLNLRAVVRKSSYDVGRLLTGREKKISEFLAFLSGESKEPFRLIGAREKKEIAEALAIFGGGDAEDELAALRELKRETEEIERETGKYELCIGYPFVLGSIRQGIHKIAVKAPLLLYPVRIEMPDDKTAELRLIENEKIQINRALIFAYAQSKKIDVDSLSLDFDSAEDCGAVENVISYLAAARIPLSASDMRNFLAYRFNDPKGQDELTVHPAAVLGRFPLANSIYNDYTALERQKLSNDAILELLRTGGKKKQKKKVRARRKEKGPAPIYPVKTLDYAQEEVLRRVDENGNMVIYGPPGTGKSQTIVNLITDAITKGRRVLVVSQKKAALDVVYNRLGKLSGKATYITDESKERTAFYTRCAEAHKAALAQRSYDLENRENDYKTLQKKLSEETAALEAIDRLMNTKRPFGLSLAEMYSSSALLSKSGWEYDAYSVLKEDRELLALNYAELTEALININTKGLAETYYKFLEEKEENPVIDHLREDADINTVAQTADALAAMTRGKKAVYQLTKYPYYRQVVAYYYELKKDENLTAAVDLEHRFSGKHRVFSGKEKAQIREQYEKTLAAVDAFAATYDFLRAVLDDDGYLSVIDNLVRGNLSYLKYVGAALDKFIALRDMGTLFSRLNPHMTAVMNFAFTASKNQQNYLAIIHALPQIRIYHELLKYEEECKEEFAKMVEFPHICARIANIKEQLLDVAADLCDGRTAKDYAAFYEGSANKGDYDYQISKTQKFLPIRKFVSDFGDYVLKLFPCWLLSPENVSNLLPLTKDLFDLVIFDEASQVFIENTIPTIFRGRCIVVAGDAKQLRPSAVFMRRYLGADPAEAQEDYAVQAALEADSLLDLAVARYASANLTYHYRSRRSELIDFSNSAFYERKLQIVPNLKKGKNDPPIVRLKVPGRWIGRKNVAEAERVVELLGQIFRERKNNESVGVITFNADQQSCIADAIDRAAAKDPEFRSQILKERHRVENGEDTGIFIRNLENVQGDERDIIIFSIGYAENEQKKIYTNFGSLSAEGGENRLNVAVTRAKEKIYVVTSIEPEELKIEDAKNNGPRLLQLYLQYARAVSDGKTADAAAILEKLNGRQFAREPFSGLAPIEEQIKERLEKAGYSVDLHLGAPEGRITLAVYDADLDRYLVGVQLDSDAYIPGAAAVERDVTRPLFFESRGWTVLRVFSRDFWISPQAVVKTIAQAADKSRQALTGKK